MTKQDVFKVYGKSVYQIQLELAMNLFLKDQDARLAFINANQFVEALLEKKLKPKT